MLLAVDIGNTHITIGAFRPPSRTVAASWRLATRRDSTEDEYGVLLPGLLRAAGLDPAGIRDVIVSSVVPPLDPVFRELARKYFKATALFVGPGMKTGVRVLYDNPAEVGADRIVNAAAAHARVKGACVVVDFGTATTFDCVSARGDYLGGVIAPGPMMAARALAEKTAKLPLLGVFRRPARVIGKNTLDSMSSGLFHGYVGLTEEILRRLKAEMGGKPAVLATGGLAGLLAPSVKDIQKVIPDLTLEGLFLLWTRNR